MGRGAAALMESRISAAFGNCLIASASSYTAPRAAGLPESSMYFFWLSADVMHLAASSANVSLYGPYAPIANPMPPNGGLLSWPALTRGYRAQPTSSRMLFGMTPLPASLMLACQMYGQLSRNPPRLLSNSARACSSVSVDRVGLAATDLASLEMIDAACLPAGLLTRTEAFAPFSGSAMICPPAEATSALIHTM